MIDLDSGAIEFDDFLSIDAQSPLSRMEEIPGTRSAPSIPGRYQLSIGTHPVHGEMWGVGLVYLQSKLNQVWLQCLSVDGVDSNSWSLENEKLRKTAHDVVVNELCSSGGSTRPPGPTLVFKFPWGKVSSILDIRGVQALIVVEYSNN